MFAKNYNFFSSLIVTFVKFSSNGNKIKLGFFFCLFHNSFLHEADKLRTEKLLKYIFLKAKTEYGQTSLCPLGVWVFCVQAWLKFSKF